MSRFLMCPEVYRLYEQTAERAVGRSFIFEISSREEAIAEINNAFYAAASVNEIAAGEEPGEDRQLDMAEARLAIAALNLASGDRFLSANEGHDTHRGLEETIDTMRAARSTGRSYAEHLMQQSAERGRGWRRISDRSVSREIRGVFRSEDVTGLDGEPGMSAVDAVFAAYGFNFQAGGNDSNIDFNDAMFASVSIEGALRGLRTFYS